MRVVDIVIGLVSILFAALVLNAALALEFFQRSEIPGPGFLPTLLAIAIGVVGVLMFVTRVFARSDQFEAFTPPSFGELGRSLAAWGGLLLTIFLMEKIGFLLASVVLVGMLLFGIERLRSFPAIASVVGIPVVFFIVFSVLLNVPLPVGPWGF